MADETTTNQAHTRLLRYFAFQHLPADLQLLSAPVGELATAMAALLHDATDPAEVTVGLRKLLEAKDCFVRAALWPRRRPRGRGWGEMSDAHPILLDFYFSQQHQDAKRGRLKRVQWRAGCRMVPEQRGYARLQDGRVVEFSMMQPSGRDVTPIPVYQRYTDFVFLGTGTFSHWGEALTAPPTVAPPTAAQPVDVWEATP